jgi:hypothetical protein
LKRQRKRLTKRGKLTRNNIKNSKISMKKRDKRQIKFLKTLRIRLREKTKSGKVKTLKDKKNSLTKKLRWMRREKKWRLNRQQI